MKKCFKKLPTKESFFASSSTGEQFENNFRNELKKHFSEINGDLVEGLSHIEEKSLIRKSKPLLTNSKSKF
ncbi:hypothetical protein Kyoto1A_01180 [Helicobacter pylori]